MNHFHNFLKQKGKILLCLSLALIMMLSFTACKDDIELNYSNPMDENSSGTSSIVFIDDDRNEDVSSGLEQNDHTEQIESAGGTSSKVNNNNNNNNINNNNTTSKQPTTNTVKPVGKGKFTPVKLSDLPGFNGSKYYVVSGNIPNFSVAELTTKSYEKYSELDSLGRVGPAIASLSKDTMPAAGEARGDISSVKPTGWIQGKYSIVPSSWLYNRSHLIAWQLSAENANKQNLMTGTQFFNQSCMKTWENMVADYIKETGNHVAYRVTPIFEGSNLLAHGVQMEAYSIEDGGKGICFNIFIYNVQEGITINYATGANSLAS